MCRFVIYKGTNPVQLSHLLTRPCHSIINQAFDSRLRVDLRRPINGDGFGVGWYDSVKDDESGSQPCIFTSVTPAWNNVNLTRLAEKIKSPLVFAHVRATTEGSLSLDNCHPFSFKKLMFMHNGGIAEFSSIKRRLQRDLPDDIFDVVLGNTDSEWAFALFLSKLPDPHAPTFSPSTLKQAMLDTIAALNAYAEDADITEPSLMNFCVTDGESVIATRYISSLHDEAASLWFSSGTTFSEYAQGGHYKMNKTDKRENIIMIASEPLTFEKADWMEIKSNNLVLITPKMNILQYPIVDRFYVRPSGGSRTGPSCPAMGTAGRQRQRDGSSGCSSPLASEFGAEDLPIPMSARRHPVHIFRPIPAPHHTQPPREADLALGLPRHPVLDGRDTKDSGMSTPSGLGGDDGYVRF